MNSRDWTSVVSCVHIAHTVYTCIFVVGDYAARSIHRYPKVPPGRAQPHRPDLNLTADVSANRQCSGEQRSSSRDGSSHSTSNIAATVFPENTDSCMLSHTSAENLDTLI